MHRVTPFLRRCALGTALALGLLMLGPGGPASAEPGCRTIQVTSNPIVFKVVCPGDPGFATGPEGDSGGPSEPTCTLSGLADYCIGTSACWANIPSALDPATWPEESRPSPEAIYTYQSCTPDPGGLSGWSWYTPPEISVGELARQAFGSLQAPAFSPSFNPPGRAVVGVGTWFWAQTAEPGTIRSAAALGVVALGDPDRLEVDPGDGSAILSCAWSTAQSQACSYTYPRSSAREPAGSGGVPAYTARMRLVYDVRFQNNGVALVLPGLPVTLESPWQSVSLPVAEVQSLVTSNGS